jgi:hypothetical protein
VLLIKGATGTGKTHTLLTAIRHLHQEGSVYAALFPMVDLVAEKDLDVWLLRALVSRLSERYLVAGGAPSPLTRLAQTVVAQGQPDLAKAFEHVFSEGGDIRDFDLRPLIVSIRARLQKLSHLPDPSEAFIAALLGAGAGDDDSLAYLRGQPVNVGIGGVRLAQTADDHIPRAHIDALVNVIGATGGALMLARPLNRACDSWEVTAAPVWPAPTGRNAAALRLAVLPRSTITSPKASTARSRPHRTFWRNARAARRWRGGRPGAAHAQALRAVLALRRRASTSAALPFPG